MKKGLFIVLILSVLLAPGCDMIRKAAGRPTSEDINNRRMEIAAAQEREEASRARQQEIADSLQAVEQLREDRVSLKSADEIGVLYADSLDSLYYIVLGAFKDSRNVDTMLKKASDAGYIPVKINFGGGLTAVAVSPVNSLREAEYALNGLLREEFCPIDAWILVNR